MLFPSEMIVLMAVVGTGDFSRGLLNRPMDVTGQYIGYLYDSLVKRGYLEGNNSGGYRLTSKGKETFHEFVVKNKTKVKDTMKTLKQLGIGIGQQIEELEREASEVR